MFPENDSVCTVKNRSERGSIILNITKTDHIKTWKKSPGYRIFHNKRTDRKEERTMEIVLLEDVKALGKKGQVVKVNDGYARNFILPKKLGVEANSRNLNDLKLQKANEAKVAAEQLAAAKELAEKLEKASVTVSIKAGEGGRAFGSVSSKEIAKAVSDQLKLDVDKKKIVLNDPIKAIGSFEVPIKLHKEVTAKLAVKVVEA